MLDAAKIIAEAEARVGMADPEAEALEPNLGRLVEAINAEARLSPEGEEITRQTLAKRTQDRIEGLQWLDREPEIGAEPIDEPVFLTGLPRSGTTFFQYLFDRDPRFRLIRTWEAITPSPPPGADRQSAVERLEAERQRRRSHAVAGFEAMHLYDADGPEECHAYLEQTYAAAGFHNMLRVPSFFDYLVEEADFIPAYRAHKRQLQLLQWRSPPARWALKYPNHVIAMDAILAVHPDARFVMTHRDPVQTLASIAKMTLKLRETRSLEPVDPKQVGRDMLHFLRRHIDRIMAFDGTEAGARVVHVDYYRLLDDPVTVMGEVHDMLGIDTPEEVRSAVAEWHRANPKGSRGANPYALEDFGLDGDEAAGLFSDYMRRFDVPREAAGLERAHG
jgi:hypothetical protein